MKYRKIGMTDIEVSEISLGTWTLGGDADKGNTGYKAADEKEGMDAIHYALDKGVNHLDTADVYGMGKSETILAKALGNKSKEVVIATKMGWYKGDFEHAYVPGNIRKQCEFSLKNLKRDHIDIYYFHNCDFGENDKYLDDAVKTMNQLKDEGKIRAIGLSGYSADDFLRLIPKVKPSCLQSWANYLHDEFIVPGSDLTKLLKKENISFVAFNPLSRGLLTGKFTSKNPPFFDKNDVRSDMEEFKTEYLRKFEPKFGKIKEKFGDDIKSLAGTALKYILFHETVACVIPGFRNREQVEINLSCAGESFTEEDVEFIKNLIKM